MATSTAQSDDSLPLAYDELVEIERLEYDRYNPRNVAPKDELVRSIKQDGIRHPLIVWPDEERDVYYITDGWQRYQAATQVGWEELPVLIYNSVDEALKVAETESIVRDWSSYTWASYCKAVADRVDASSHREQVRKVSKRVNRSRSMVSQYLAAMALPEEVHVLLSDAPDESDHAWQALTNYNEDVKRYSGLSWEVAAKLGRAYRSGDITTTRAISLAANAVEYNTEMGNSFVEMGCEEPGWPVQTVHRMIQQDMKGAQYLQVPRVAVPMSDDEKQRMMEYCADRRMSLSALVREGLQEFADTL